MPWGLFAILYGVDRGGLIGRVIFEQRPTRRTKQALPILGGRMFQAESRASIKALR